MTTQLQAQWIVGFVDGEGCFHISITKNNTMTLKKQVIPEFVVVQHKRDVQLLHALKEYFGCGVVRDNRENGGNRKCYRVRGHKHLKEIIIPFFEKHKLRTKKRIDFEKFRDVILLMAKGKHLSQEGLDEIYSIKRELVKIKEN